MKTTEAGFTLIEMMAATAILAAIGLLVGVSIQSFHRSYSQAQRVGNELRRNLAIDRLVDSSIAGAVPFVWYDEDESKERRVFNGESDELLTASLRRSYAGESGLRFTRIYLDGNRLMVDHAGTPLLPWQEWEDQNFETETIAEGVKQIAFRYAESSDDDEVEWLDEWVEDDHNDNPLAIQLTVEWEDGTTERWLRRTAGVSAFTTFGERSGPTE